MERIQPQEFDHVTVRVKGEMRKGWLMRIHSNGHLYSVLLDGEQKARTFQAWEVSKCIPPLVIAKNQWPSYAYQPKPSPWWKRLLFRLL